MTHVSFSLRRLTALPLRHPLAALGLLLATAGTALAQTPTVVRASLAPAANARAASRSTQVVIPYSRNLDANTVGNVRLFSQQYRGRRTATAALQNSNTIQLTPTVPATGSQVADFKPGETVFVSALASVRSSANQPSAPYVYQFTAAVTGGAGTFAGGSDPAVGSYPYSVAVGDVDGDGDLDLFAANNRGNTVSVRLNNGSGTFTGGSDPAVGNGPISMAVGDVDGDGDLDLLTANYDNNTVSVRLNDGSGTFTGGSDATVSSYSASVALGDVDGDGDLDLLTSNYNGNTASVRLNTPPPTMSNFTPPSRRGWHQRSHHGHQLRGRDGGKV